MREGVAEAMTMDKTLWGIHGGKTGDADSIFLKKNRIAIGWEKMGDLGALPAERYAFKLRLEEAVPDRKPGYYPLATGQLFRFVHTMQKDDLIIYPSKRDRQVHIGRITGSYQHVNKNADPREVKPREPK